MKKKNQTNATNETMPLLGQAIWGNIWKYTVEKSQTNATNVIMHPPGQTVWGRIWKRTVEKSQTNAASECDFASCHPSALRTPLKIHRGQKSDKCNQCDYASSRAGNLMKHIKIHVVKSQTNAANVIMHALIHVHWRHIWKHTAGKNITNVTMPLLM